MLRLERMGRAAELAPSRNFDDEDESMLPLRRTVAADDEERESTAVLSLTVTGAPAAVPLLIVASGDAVVAGMRRIFRVRELSPVAQLNVSEQRAASAVYAVSDGVWVCLVAQPVSRDDGFAVARLVSERLAPERVVIVEALSFEDRAAAMLPARDRSGVYYLETPAHRLRADRPDLAAQGALLDSFVLSSLAAAFVSHAAVRKRAAVALVVDAAADGDTSHALLAVLNVLAAVVPLAAADVARSAAVLAKPSPTFNPLFM